MSEDLFGVFEEKKYIKLEGKTMKTVIERKPIHENGGKSVYLYACIGKDLNGQIQELVIQLKAESISEAFSVAEEQTKEWLAKQLHKIVVPDFKAKIVK